MGLVCRVRLQASKSGLFWVILQVVEWVWLVCRPVGVASLQTSGYVGQWVWLIFRSVGVASRQVMG